MTLQTLFRSLFAFCALCVFLPASLASAAPVTVAYQVTGTGKANELIYWNELGEKVTENNVALPWSKTVSISKTMPIMLRVIVPSGEVGCKITVNGKATSEKKNRYSAQCASDISGS